jgi:SAM-dependent methyltransferase
MSSAASDVRESDLKVRAALSRGQSDDAVHALVKRVLGEKEGSYKAVVDLGCGKGEAARLLAGMYGSYSGVDVLQYPGFSSSPSVRLIQANLDVYPLPIEAETADLVLSIETIEHLENPRALVREMVRIARPGGRIVLTTPNQLSLASKLCLLVRNQFQAFQEAPGLYPSHITALVEEDLRRISTECGLVDTQVYFTDRGRIPFSARMWPRAWGIGGRWFSDNILMTARRW